MGDGGNNTAVISATPAGTNVMVNAGTQFDYIYVSNLIGTLDDLPGPLTVNGQGPTIMELDDSGNTNFSTWSVNTRNTQRQYIGIFGTPVIAEVQYNNGVSLKLDGGSGGSEFDLSPDAENLDVIPPTTVNGGGPNDAIVADDQNSPGPFLGIGSIPWAITGTSASRTAYEGRLGAPSGTTTFDYNGVPNITINANAASNSFNLSPTQHDLDELPADINIAQPLGGASNIVLNDQANPEHADQQNVMNPTSWLVTNNSVARTYEGPTGEVERKVTFDNAEDPVTINAGTGDDSFLLLPLLNVGGFRALPVNVTIDGGGGSNSMQLNDTLPDDAFNGTQSSRSYMLQHSMVIRTDYFATDVINYANLSRLEIDGYNQSRFYVENTAARTTTVLQGGDGGNSFDFGAQAALKGPLQLDGNGSGNTLSRAEPFDNFSLPGTNLGLTSIVAGPDGAFWFIESSTNRIGRITTDGSVAEFSLGPATSASNLDKGFDGGLWFIDQAKNQIDRFDPATHVVSIMQTAEVSRHFNGLAATPDGLWFIEYFGDLATIGRIASGVTTFTPLSEFAQDLTVGPDGSSVWFIESPAILSAPDHLGEIAGGAFSQVPFSLPPSGSSKTIITSFVAGPDGNFWATAVVANRLFQKGEIFKVSTAGTVQVFKLPGSDNTLASSIIAGPDGNLWFAINDTDLGTYALAQITPSGNVQEFTTPGFDVLALASGPNQTIWFTEPSADQIGEFFIPQQQSVWRVTGPDSGLVDNNVAFQSMQNLTGGDAGADVFLFITGETQTGSLSGALTGGLGNETLDFSRVAGGVQYSVTGRGTAHGAKGTASVIGSGFDNIDLIVMQGATGIKIDDTANTAPTIWSITSTGVTRQVEGQMPTTIGLGSAAGVEIDAGSGGNMFHVLSTAAGTPLTLDGGSGGDAYDFGDPTHPLTNLQAPITLNMGAGANSMLVDASGMPLATNLVLDLNALITGVSLPAVDASGKDAGAMTVQFPPSAQFSNGVVFKSSALADNVSILGLPANSPFTSTGSGTGTIIIGGQSGLDPIHSPINVLSSASLALHDESDTQATDFNLDGSTLIFRHPITLASGTSSGGLVVNYSSVGSLQVNAGTGQNFINVAGTAAGTSTTITSAGRDIVNVGSGGSVQGILGPLTINSASASMTVDDSADPTSRTVTLTPTAIQGLAPAEIDYGPGVFSLTVNGGYGGNTIVVQNTAAGTNTTVNSGNGVDVVYVTATTGPLNVNTQQSSIGPGFGGFEGVWVGFNPKGNTLDPIQGAVNVNTVARPGIDYADLEVVDTATTAPETFTVTKDTILRTGAAPIHYHVTNSLDFFLGKGGNAVNVQSISPGLLTTFAGGVGNDVFNVGDTNNTLDSITYILLISIQNPGSQVILHDEGKSANLNYSLASVIVHPTVAINLPAYRIVRSDWDPLGHGPAVYLTGPILGSPPLPLQSLQLKAGSGNNTFNVQSLPPGNPTVTLDGGGGSNTIQGPNQENVWQLSGVNAGSLDSNINFTDAQGLVGGSANDKFAIKNGGSLAGTLDGGGGTNTLDYSAYVGDASVDLPLHLASLVNQTAANSVTNIQNAVGSQGNDLFVGDANPNVFTGGTGRNVFIGGTGADTLDASPSRDDNILIGGTTDWDLDLTALDAIMNEWDRTDLNPNSSFQVRFNDLLSGSGSANPLNKVNGQIILLTPATNSQSTNGTVHADGASDTLIGTTATNPQTGKRAHNWFLYDALDRLINLVNSSDRESKTT